MAAFRETREHVTQGSNNLSMTDITDIVDASGLQDWQGCLRHWLDILNKLSGSIFNIIIINIVESD